MTFTETLVARIADLERRLHLAQVSKTRQRNRAEMWKARWREAARRPARVKL